MNILPIKTDAAHEVALREIEALWGAPEVSPEGNRLDLLSTMVESYEEARWPLTGLAQLLEP